VLIHTKERTDMPRKAPSDGRYTIDGVPHKIRKGDPIPDGAEFAGAAGDGEQEEAAPAGPAETTEAAGPAETAEAAPAARAGKPEKK
jgi:hypothetical protein